MAISISVLLHQTSVQRMYEQILFELIPLLTSLQPGESRETVKFALCYKVLYLCPSQWHCCFLSSSLFPPPILPDSSRRCSQLKGARQESEVLQETTGILGIVLTQEVRKTNLQWDDSQTTRNYK